MRFDFLYNLCLKHFSQCEELSEILSKMYIGLHVKYVSFLSDFNENWILSTDFRKILKYQFSRESAQRETSCYMRTEGQTDMKALLVA